VCEITLREYHNYVYTCSSQKDLGKVNNLKNLIIGIAVLAVHLKEKIPYKLAKKIGLIEEFGIKYTY